MLNRTPAFIVLDDGTVYRGSAYGAEGKTLGEFVFRTASTGYQELLTDPESAGKILVMTYPHMGNTGVNAEDTLSDKVQAAGFVIRDAALRASNFRSTGELEDYLRESGTVGITDVDTRALTRHLRDSGPRRGGIFSGSALPSASLDNGEAALNVLKAIVTGKSKGTAPGVAGASGVGETTKEAFNA